MIKRKYYSILFLIMILAVAFLSGCNGEDKVEESQGGKNMALQQLELPTEGEEIIVMDTNHGTIKIRLFPEVAPKAVENFKTHVEDGYYTGLTFHRIIEDFMIQGGDPNSNGTGGESIWGSPFEDEFDVNYHNFRGALSMANSGPNTNGSQFFIVQNSEVQETLIEQIRELGEEGGYPEDVADAYAELGGTPHLDYRHTVFGQVFEGMDVVDEIAAVETDGSDKPMEPVAIEKIEVAIYK